MLKGSAFPLQQGLNRVSTGTFELITAVRGHEESTLLITHNNGTSWTATVGAGEDREIESNSSVEVLTGLVCLARKTVV